jgi:hypothetical protein
MGKDVYSGHEWNIATVDRIVMLMEEIAVLENKFKENSGMGNINTAIGVLKQRVIELKGRIDG